MFFEILVLVCLAPHPVFSAVFKAKNKELSPQARDQLLLSFQEPSSPFQSQVTVNSNQNNVIGLTDHKSYQK